MFIERRNRHRIEGGGNQQSYRQRRRHGIHAHRLVTRLVRADEWAIAAR